MTELEQTARGTLGGFMKYIKQFMIIMIIAFMGECIKELLPFKIPASVYGLALMLIGLMSGIIKLEAVKETAEFFVAVLPVMFIAPSVGLLSAWPQLKSVVLPFCIIAVISTFIVMVVTGRVSQMIIRFTKPKLENNSDSIKEGGNE